MPKSVENLARARAALAQGKPKRALAAGWDAARDGFRTGDFALLDEVARVAGELAAGLEGRSRAQAEMLRAYCEGCASDARAGERALTPLERLLDSSGLGRRKRKTCPECAEKVQLAARVCRYCGHRFDGA